MTLTFHFLVETNCLTKSGWVSLRINCMSGGSPAGVALRTRCGSGRLFLDVLQLFLGEQSPVCAGGSQPGTFALSCIGFISSVNGVSCSMAWRVQQHPVTWSSSS